MANDPIHERQSNFRVWFLISLSVIIVLAAGAATYLSLADAPESAKSALLKRSIPFTQEEFVKKASSGDLESIKLFLQAGIDPNSRAKSGVALLNAIAPIDIEALSKVPKTDIAKKVAAYATVIKNSLNAELLQEEVVNYLLQHGADPNTQLQGLTPLILATLLGDQELVSKLIDSGAQIDGTGSDGLTALSHAIIGNQPELFDQLLKEGAQVGTGSIPPLAVALFQDKNELVKRLLQLGADATLCSSSISPINVAARFSPDSLPELVSAGAAIHQSSCENQVPPLTDAILADNPASIDVLIKLGAKVESMKGSEKTLFPALMNDSKLPLLNRLLKLGMTIDTEDHSALLVAIENRQLKTAQTLVESGANLSQQDVQGSSAMHLAARFADSAFAQLLIDNGAELNARDILGRSPLMHALAQGNESFASALLDNKANPYLLDNNNKRTIDFALATLDPSLAERIDPNIGLSKAISDGDEQHIQELLRAGGDPNSYLKSGLTVTHFALKQGQLKALEMLIAAGGDLTLLHQHTGATALMIAISGEKLESVELALQQSENINSVDGKGLAAIHRAILQKNTSIFKAILSKNPDLSIQGELISFDGQSGVLPFAIGNGSPEIVSLLLSSLKKTELSEDTLKSSLSLAVAAKETSMLDALIPYCTGRINSAHDAIKLALTQQSPKILETLLNAFSFSSKHRDSYYIDLIRSSDLTSLEILHRHGFDITSALKGTPVEIILAKRGNREMLDFILSNGGKVNVQDKKGDTPLMIAAESRNTKLVSYLLQRGANKKILNRSGECAGSKAFYAGSQDLADVLSGDSSNPSRLCTW